MAQQVIRRCALVHAPAIKIAAVIDMPEMRQRISQRHHAAEVGDVFIRDYVVDLRKGSFRPERGRLRTVRFPVPSIE